MKASWTKWKWFYSPKYTYRDILTKMTNSRNCRNIKKITVIRLEVQLREYYQYPCRANIRFIPSATKTFKTQCNDAHCKQVAVRFPPLRHRFGKHTNSLTHWRPVVTEFHGDMKCSVSESSWSQAQMLATSS